eukprot:g3725.t1
MPQLMERARECLESNCPKQALKILRRIKSYENEDQKADVFYIKGIALGKTGQIKDAVESLSRVLRINPSYETVRAFRGMHLASLGLYTLALEDYNEAIRMDPDDSASIFNRAEAFSRLEMFEECVQDLDAYLKLEPKDNDAIKLREKTNRRLHRKRRREDETENDMVTPPQSPKKNDDEKKPCPTTPRSALKKRGENRKKRTKTPKKRVAFNKILIREFNRELGGSGGVPEVGGIALGLGDIERDRSPIPLDVYERTRSPHRSSKDEYRPSPARKRRQLLIESMGKEEYKRKHKEEREELIKIRKNRHDSEENDPLYNPYVEG